MSLFDVRGIVSQVGAGALGKSLSVYDVVESSVNRRGDSTKVKTSYSIDGVVQVMTGAEEEVQVGLLQTGDLMVFVSDLESNVGKLKNGNEFLYEGVVYKIKNVIQEVGHREVHAKRG